MQRRSVTRYKSGKALLKALSDNPALAEFVPRLPVGGLKRLVEEVGLADAGELIVYATSNQLFELIDEAVWQVTAPGAPESFTEEAFCAWMATLLDVGDEFAVRHFVGLDDDLVLLAMMRLLFVADLSARVLDPSDDEAFELLDSTALNKELYGNFEVTPRSDQHWDTVQRLLAALHTLEPAFLEVALRRCCLPETMLRYRAEHSVAGDAQGAHQLRRTAAGYLASEIAGDFLRSARESDMSQLLEADAYDLDTAYYFSRARRHALESSLAGTDAPKRLGQASPDSNSSGDENSSRDENSSKDENLSSDEYAGTDEHSPSSGFSPAGEDDMAALQTIVTDLEMAAMAGAVPLLGGASDTDDAGAGRLRRALGELADAQPAALQQRMAELAYLSNVLMTGVWLEDQRLNHSEAVAAVTAVCSLGLERAPQIDLAHEPGLVGVFRVGWHILQTVPDRVIDALEVWLSDPQVAASLGLRNWIVEDLRGALSGGEFIADVAGQAYEEVHNVLKMFGLILQQPAVDHLCLLVDHLPTTVAVADAHRLAQRRRFIQSAREIEQIEAFVANLDRWRRAPGGD
ncbi:MAG: DUF6178 family protein [Pseudomonadota bacterium]